MGPRPRSRPPESQCERQRARFPNFAAGPVEKLVGVSTCVPRRQLVALIRTKRSPRAKAFSYWPAFGAAKDWMPETGTKFVFRPLGPGKGGFSASNPAARPAFVPGPNNVEWRHGCCFSVANRSENRLGRQRSWRPSASQPDFYGGAGRAFCYLAFRQCGTWAAMARGYGICFSVPGGCFRVRNSARISSLRE